MTATEGFENFFSELTHLHAYLPVAVYHHGDRVNKLTRELSQMFAVARQKLAASVVISAWPEVPIRQVVADLARPAVMVWNRIKTQDYDRPMSVQMMQ